MQSSDRRGVWSYIIDNGLLLVIGTVVALMIPYVLVILIAWVILFVVWFWLGVPLGPGYPISA